MRVGAIQTAVLAAVIAVVVLGVDGLASPAAAQIYKPEGFAIPWFHSAADRRAREACEQNLPECRPSVRQQINDEKAASLITPWIILGVAVLGVLLYLRAQERKKVKHRQQAQRRHDPKAYRKLDQTKEDRGEQTQDDAF